MCGTRRWERDRRRRSSDPSSTAETDGHLIAIDNDRHRATAAAVAKHAVELRRVLLDVDVFERDMPPDIVLTGG